MASGLSLPTLAPDELFAYLCVHGSSSVWFRLKWIADLAALIGGADQAEIERLYRRSQRLGAGRAAAQAMLLGQRLFDLPVGRTLACELAGDRISRLLYAAAMRKLAGRAVAAELDQMPLGTATMHLTQLGLMPGWRFRFGEAWRQLANPYDRLAVPLPRPLQFLYPAVFVLRRIGRRVRRRRPDRDR